MGTPSLGRSKYRTALKDSPSLANQCLGKSEKVAPGDPLQPVTIKLASSTSLDHLQSGSLDMVITDPPFGDNIQYAELSVSSMYGFVWD